jgi:hypothetical protein
MRKVIENRQKLVRPIAYAAFAGGIIDILFWALYLTGTISFGPSDSSVAHFESAFLFADAVLAGILFISGFGLIKEKLFGVVGLIVAASMGLYLGFIDVAFYANQGLYFPLTSSSLFEIFINAVCLLGGAAGLILGLVLMGAATNQGARP